MEYVAALLPVGEAVYALIAKAVAGEKLTAQQITAELGSAVNACIARISELAADIAGNDAIVDAELAPKK